MASLPRPSAGLISEIGPRLETICPEFPTFRHTPLVVFTWPAISPAYQKIYRTAVFKIHNPSQKKRAMLRNCMRQGWIHRSSTTPQLMNEDLGR
jgi:hypothetical protein